MMYKHNQALLLSIRVSLYRSWNTPDSPWYRIVPWHGVKIATILAACLSNIRLISNWSRFNHVDHSLWYEVLFVLSACPCSSISCVFLLLLVPTYSSLVWIACLCSHPPQLVMYENDVDLTSRYVDLSKRWLSHRFNFKTSARRAWKIRWRRWWT